MRLDSVRLHQVGPFEDLTVDLRALGEAAKLVAVVGPNGAGKSTFLEAGFPGALYRECPTRGPLTKLARGRESFVETKVTNGSTWTLRHTLDAVSKKSEAVVLNAEGRPAFDSSKVKAFDAWSAEHMPPKSVFLSTVFAAQKQLAFTQAKEGERKAIILRIKGVEEIEALALEAREQARGARGKVEEVARRLAELGPADVAGAEQALEAARLAAAAGDEAVAAARKALDAGKATAVVREQRQREVAEIGERRKEIETRLKARETELADVEERVRNNQRILDDAEKIRAAEAEVPQLRAEIARLEPELAGTEERRAAGVREGAAYARQVTAAQAAAKTAGERAKRARERLADREAVARAALHLPDLERFLAQAQAAEKAAAAELEQVRGERLAGADERIASLRAGLEGIAEADQDIDSGGLAMMARQRLDADDDAVALATALPGRVRDAEAAHRAARQDLDGAQQNLAGAQRIAARMGEIHAAEREATEADADLARAVREGADAARERDAVVARVEDLEKAAGIVRRSLDAAREKLAPAEKLAARAKHLDEAQARIDTHRPRLEAIRAELAEHHAAIAALPPAPEVPAPPMIGQLEAELARADRAARDAHQAVPLAERARDEATVAAARRAALDTERAAAEAELADWAKLGEDLGRDGLQALLIDEAGPEVTAVANELLHSAFGPRFTVRLDTQKLASDGRTLLETFDVMVLDTVMGREDRVETLSGGEEVFVAEALSLALTTVACREAGLVRPTIVRDEAGAALDPVNARQWVAMLRRCAELADLDRILLVSHSPEVQELCDARIDVSQGRAS